MTTLEEPSPQKRQQILRGAERVFTESGFEGASMSRIAAEAGVSKGTLYNYFTSKSDLFAAFMQQRMDATLSHIFDGVGDEAELGDTLHGIGMRIMQLLLSPPNLVLYRIMISEAGRFPHLARLYWQAGPERALRHMAGWVADQVAQDRLRTDDVQLAAEQFFALCQTKISLRCRLLLEQDPPHAEMDRVVTGAVRLFLNSYGSSGPQRP
ncbi:TetR/AcrR family transcriptional regulator [Rhizosaccharibacter radicis]|uniref:TetR/AcrR family transcriptional regulator n=1 Tax=Rhizosaccharibacter radicis TaxID=2782605 RepID=A0ABT1W1S0_9PROT|nr:TetR/AcrR family transcriptional regulator [Acetobacteraceae bacterium KSS12]